MTVPIAQGIDDRPVDTSDPDQLDDFVNRRLLPLIRDMRKIINEENTLTESAHSNNYAWNLDRFGTLFIEQTSGNLAISVDSSVTLARLRQGRRVSVVVYNNSGGNVDVTFSADFAASGATIANGNTGGWDFVVKDVDFGLSGTLLEVG